jgi:uncharacterized protein (DUF2252 family)
VTDIMTSSFDKGIGIGKARRVTLPRKALNALGGRPDGFDPLSLLEAQAKDRVPDLVPLRYTRMAASEFAFLRGAAAIMAYDLALCPNTGLEAQICGDAHVANFGVFYSPERRLVFDVNDFDETLPGPFEWDLKRLAASAAVALDGMGFSEKDSLGVLTGGLSHYRSEMKAAAQLGNLDVWYEHLDIERSLGSLRKVFRDEQRSPVDVIVARARRSDSKQAFKKLIVMEGGRMQFRNDPPLLVPLTQLDEHEVIVAQEPDVLERGFSDYAESLPDDLAHLLGSFEMVDIARKVVGVGSVGTRCFVGLFIGRSYGDPLILQAKEALPSVLESHLGPSRYPTSGQRVVEGQRLMQTTPDIFLGFNRVKFSESETHDFYFRQFHDGKASVDFSAIHDVQQATAYLGICAWTLARAHARSGDRVAISSYIGGSDAFDRAIAEWGMSYKERNHRDFVQFTDAIASGRLQAMAEQETS